MPRRSLPGQRGFLDHQTGKGSADRSPGWRANYGEIDFVIAEDDGFHRRGTKLIKLYGKPMQVFCVPKLRIVIK